jgi:hypothetical protein
VYIDKLALSGNFFFSLAKGLAWGEREIYNSLSDQSKEKWRKKTEEEIK